MKKGSVTATVLVLTLLTHTAAAVGRVPCMMGSPEPASANPILLESGHALTAHTEHAAHHHAAPAQQAEAQAERDLPEEPGGCCDGMTTQDCATSGCTAGSGTVLAPPVTGPAVTQVNAGVYREPTWLPPYLTPTATIFRPPIA